MQYSKTWLQRHFLRLCAIALFAPQLAKAGDTLSARVNKSPTLNDIADNILCYTRDQQTILLHGISAGPETWQRTKLTVTCTNAVLFDRLEANKLANGNGYVKYHIASGRAGSALVTVTVTDDGGNANGGINSISRSFTVTVNPLPLVNTSYTLLNAAGVNGKYAGSNNAQTIKLSAVSPGAVRYNWYPEQLVNNASSATPEYYIQESGPRTFFVTVTNMYGCKTVDSLVVKSLAAGKLYSLSVFPNPVSKNAEVQFIIPHDELYVAVEVYSAAGSKLSTLYQGQAKGKTPYSLRFDGSPYVAGVYFIKLSTPGHEEGFKLVLAK
ncbi:MAG TPA: T9SS type A sorting domain-containing protein [Chitinophagaceae bacterium]|nr:T9SS type A sorting domain-containing protein [Chitinophagaceae bacterium]